MSELSAEPISTTETTCVDVSVAPLPTPLTYAIGNYPQDQLCEGVKVLVPLGSRTIEGYVLRPPYTAQVKHTVRPISKVLTASACFTKEQRELFEWIADYYCEPISSILEVAIPRSAEPRMTSSYSVSDSAPELGKLGSKQRALLEFIRERSPSVVLHEDIVREFPGSAASLRSLVTRSLLSQYQIVVDEQQSGVAPMWAKRNVELTAAQKAAVDSVKNNLGTFHPILLHGVTGSGKTEVYIDAARATLSAGKGVLLLVPEIALTPQLIDRLRSRVGFDLAVLHSNLSPRSRWQAWQKLLAGSVHFAVGVRSAVFAPLSNIGLIIVDEEHDGSYKQSDGVRYHARDIAVYRAHANSCPVILGSATPSLETFHNAISKRYAYAPLSERHARHASLNIEIVELSRIRAKEMKSTNVSPQLYTALQETLARNEQSFILYNRRGFASYLQCNVCETPLVCSDCNVTYTYHRGRHLLLCHYCGHQRTPPSVCSVCPSPASPTAESTLVMRGAGTEKIFEELTELFPNHSIARLDRDTVENLEQYRSILDRVRSRETSILVGTQMIAKGHDLPHVTLVGVIDCDVGIHLPDFRASERIFQLLTQAAGRAGRGESAGRVLLQTRLATHPSIRCTVAADYEGFASQELAIRRDSSYPPFGRLVRIVIGARDSERASVIARAIREHARAFIQHNSMRVGLIGPAPAPLNKLRSFWRWHLLVKGTSSRDLRLLVRYLQSVKIPGASGSRIAFDVDPHDML